ncbi:MAG: VOC family protein [Filimonas sp.]|nr:VOC family protein [Filimonas sp.]
MHFKALTPMLWTSDLNGTIDFYKSKLGFKLDSYNDEWGWCHLHKDEVNLMFAVPNDHTPFTESKATASFYIYTDEVDELWASVKEKENVEVFYPIEDFEYNMREFAIKDNNGYILQFGKEIKEA